MDVLLSSASQTVAAVVAVTCCQRAKYQPPPPLLFLSSTHFDAPLLTPASKHEDEESALFRFGVLGFTHPGCCLSKIPAFWSSRIRPVNSTLNIDHGIMHNFLFFNLFVSLYILFLFCCAGLNAHLRKVFLLMRHLKCCESSPPGPGGSKGDATDYWNLCCIGGLKKNQHMMRRLCMTYTPAPMITSWK